MYKIYSVAFVILLSILLNKDFSYSIKNNSLLQVNSDNILVVQDTVKSSLSHNVDEVIIEYWDPFYADYFIFNIASNSDKIIFNGESVFIKDKIITSQEKRNRLINYINELYIDKEKDIILKRIKRDYLESTNYPSITITGFRNNRETLNAFNQIGDEVYEVDYNPCFLEFVNLLREIIDSNNVILSNEIDKIEISGLLFDEHLNEIKFKMYFNNDIGRLINLSTDKSKSIHNSEEVGQLIRYVNQFYIDKKDDIVLKESRNDRSLLTDYPNIKVVGYKDEKEMFKKSIQLGEEGYDIECHPKFLEFYEFLDSLIKDE